MNHTIIAFVFVAFTSTVALSQETGGSKHSIFVMGAGQSAEFCKNVEKQIESWALNSSVGDKMSFVEGRDHRLIAEAVIPNVSGQRQRLRDRKLVAALRLVNVFLNDKSPVDEGQLGQVGIPRLPALYWSLAKEKMRTRIILAGTPVHNDPLAMSWSMRDNKVISKSALEMEECPFHNKLHKKIPDSTEIVLLTPSANWSTKRHKDHIVDFLRAAFKQSLGGALTLVTTDPEHALLSNSKEVDCFEAISISDVSTKRDNSIAEPDVYQLSRNAHQELRSRHLNNFQLQATSNRKSGGLRGTSRNVERTVPTVQTVENRDSASTREALKPQTPPAESTTEAKAPTIVPQPTSEGPLVPASGQIPSAPRQELRNLVNENESRNRQPRSFNPSRLVPAVVSPGPEQAHDDPAPVRPVVEKVKKPAPPVPVDSFNESHLPSQQDGPKGTEPESTSTRESEANNNPGPVKNPAKRQRIELLKSQLKRVPQEAWRELLQAQEKNADAVVVVLTWISDCPHCDLNLSFPSREKSEFKIVPSAPRFSKHPNETLEWAIVSGVAIESLEAHVAVAETHKSIEAALQVVTSNGRSGKVFLSFPQTGGSKKYPLSQIVK